jgi:ketosteroid isomerase-like protein
MPMSVPSGVEAEFRQTNELFSKVVRERNFELLDDVYTEDARVLPPGAPLVEGRAGVKDFWQRAVAALGVEDVELNSIDVSLAGDTAVEIGRAVMTVGSGHKVSAKYVVQWRKEAGRWKWHTDIWNMNE